MIFIDCSVPEELQSTEDSNSKLTYVENENNKIKSEKGKMKTHTNNLIFKHENN